MIFETWTKRCGYAPRTIRLAIDPPSKIYIGCKDDTLWEGNLERPGDDLKQVQGPGREVRGLRALNELKDPADGRPAEGRPADGRPAEGRPAEGRPAEGRPAEGRFLAGYSNGAVEILEPGTTPVRTSVAPRPRRGSVAEDGGESQRPGPVRFLADTGGCGALLALRDGGTWFAAAVESPHSWRPLGPETLPPLRFILPLEIPRAASEEEVSRDSEGTATPPRTLWILVSERGDLWSWQPPEGGDGDPPVAEPLAGIWPEGEQPGLINDFALQRTEAARRQGHPARCLYLATDLGVYVLSLDPQLEGSDLGHGVVVSVEARRRAHPLVLCRLALPGLGDMCTTLSYAETDGASFVWAATLGGRCHLYRAPWIEGAASDAAPSKRWLNFRRVHTRRARSQVRLVRLWRSSEQTLLVAQTGNADFVEFLSIDLGAIPRQATDGVDSTTPDLALRRLLGRIGTGRPRSEAETEAMLETFARGARTYLLEREKQRRGSEASGFAEVFDDLDGRAAIVAELFEDLAEDENPTQLLTEILSGDSTVATALLLEAAAWGVEELKRRTQLWCLALLGVAHRLGTDPEIYLHIVRWFRNRQLEASEILDARAADVADGATARDLADQREALDDAIEDSVRFARKWGLFGDDQSRRRNLSRPLRILRDSLKQQDSTDATVAAKRHPRNLEALAYECLLFRRSVDEQHAIAGDRHRGRTAWDLVLQRSEDPAQPGRPIEVCAVSWRWGGVELYVLGRGPDEPGLARLADPILANPPHSPGVTSTVIRPDKYFYSRALCLGRLRRRGGKSTHFLVTAPILPPGTTERLRLYTWDFEGSPHRIELHESCETELLLKDPLDPEAPAEQESIYSLLEVRAGWLLAGLRGRGGKPRVALFRLVDSSEDPEGNTDEGQLTCELVAWRFLKDSSPQLPSHGNRVWSLALETCEPTPRADQHPVAIAIGCEGGEIFRLNLDADQLDHPETFDSEEFRRPSACWEVARMGSPVLSLAFRRQPSDGSSVRRIFAGSEDGSIVAWQESQARSDWSPRYSTLWASTEGGPISRIHLLDYREDCMVLAVTRSGRAVLFDDRARVPTLDVTETPRRIPFPGARYGRNDLRSPAFASALVASPSATDPRVFAQLLTATDKGGLRLLSLFAPALLPDRQLWFGEIQKRWHEVLHDGHLMRLTEGLHLAAPNFSLLLVRWLLDPGLENPETFSGSEIGVRTWQELLPKPWRLPRCLRPLLYLRDHWYCIEQTIGAVPEDESPPHPGDPNRAAENAGVALETALRRAWQLDDLKLFQEICAVALKRANLMIFRTMADFGHDRSPDAIKAKLMVRDLYRSLFDAIERSLPRWLGAVERKEERARMIVAKNLVDGDTFWRLVQEAEWETRAIDVPAAHAAFHIFEYRIEAVRQLVLRSDPIVNLESLRAANLSLLRLCKRLVEQRHRQWPSGRWAPGLPSTPSEAANPADPEDRAVTEAGATSETTEVPAEDPGTPARTEVSWKVFERYFESLISAAARAFHSRLEVTDSLVHEYSRTFALAICACPSATLRIANRLTEARLVSDPDSTEDLSQRVLRQFETLGTVGLEIFEEQKTLFRYGTQPTLGQLDPASALTRELFGRAEAEAPHSHRSDPGALTAPAAGSLAAHEAATAPDCRQTRNRVGEQNAEDLFCLCRIYQVVGWFTDLTEKLSTNAQNIDLGGLDAQKKALDHPVIENLYRQSRDFWSSAITSLAKELDRRTKITPRIRPEVVLLAPKIASWAGKQIRDLEERYRNSEIFQPEYPIFTQVLARLQQAAEDFPHSAAIQKNIVRGVLRHNLLASLDEHVLELEEIANTLYPPVPRIGRGDFVSSRLEPVDRRFSNYLKRHSQNAESIPKNLRTLLALLESPDPGSRVRDRTFSDLLSRYSERRGVRRWDIASVEDDEVLSEREVRFLTLALEELDHNDLKYGSGRDDGVPRPLARLQGGSTDWTTRPVRPPTRLTLVLSFSDHDSEIARDTPTSQGSEAEKDSGAHSNRPKRSNFDRLVEIRDDELQGPTPPQESRRYASTGSGLYLANFAAAVVGWRLSIPASSPKRPDPESGETWCTCAFRLQREADAE